MIEIRTHPPHRAGRAVPRQHSLTPAAASGANGLTLGNVRDLTRDHIALSIGGVTVNLKREVGDFNTLANPRIRARNKEKAKVLVGDKMPVVTTTTGTGGFVSDSVNYLDVGLKLDVEPTVYADDEVRDQDRAGGQLRWAPGQDRVRVRSPTRSARATRRRCCACATARRSCWPA